MLRIAVILIAGLAATVAAHAEKRVALVIGNNAYEHLSPLNNPIVDATRMASLLQGSGFDVMSCDGDTPGCFDLDRSGMTDALEDFGFEARDADVALVFYAGHGMQTARGNVLAPVNMELSCETLDPSRATMLDDVFDAIGNAREKIVIIDACRNDPLQAQQCVQRGGRSLSFGSIAVPNSAARFLLMSSTQPGQVAQDGLPGAHSPFALSLFQAMETQAHVPFDQMLDHVTKQVIETTTANRFTQVPEILIRGGSPETCLAGGECALDPQAEQLRAEVAQLQQENARVQEYEEIVTVILKSAGYGSLDDLPVEQRETFFRGIVDAGRALGERQDQAGEQALAALRGGDQTQARELFEQDLAAVSPDASDEERLEAAESARHLASLARFSDVAQAAKYYREAARLDPDNLQTWLDLAATARDAGMTSEALEAYREASRRARDDGDRKMRFWAAVGQAQIVLGRGQPDRALQFFEAARDLAAADIEDDPEDLDARRNMAVVLGNIGNISLSRNRFSEAETAFQQSMDIARELADAYPQYLDYQRDLAIGHTRLGSLKRARGDLEGALEEYGLDLEIGQRLAAADPANTQYQRDISVTLNAIGDVMDRLGRADEAMENYRASLEISETLAAADASNTEWQRDLSVSYNKIASMLVAQEDYDGALEAYASDLAIARKLADADPDNAGWQRDVAVSHNHIGNVQKAKGDFDAALAAYAQARAVTEDLLILEPGNNSWRRDLAHGINLVAEVMEARGDTAKALKLYEEALEQRREIAADDPDDIQYQRDVAFNMDRIASLLRDTGELDMAISIQQDLLGLRERIVSMNEFDLTLLRDISVTYNTLATLYREKGDYAAALEPLEADLAIAIKLADLDPENADWQRDVYISHNLIGLTQGSLGNRDAALAAFSKAREVMERLTADDPETLQHQRDLGGILISEGDAHDGVEDGQAALEAYTAGLEAREALANANLDDPSLQIDVIDAHGKIATLWETYGAPENAVEHREAILAIRTALAAVDPDDLESLRNVSLAHNSLAVLKRTIGDYPGALESFRADLEVAAAIADREPANTSYQRDIFISHNMIADTHVMAGDPQLAIESFAAGRAIVSTLAQVEPDNTQWLSDIAYSTTKIAGLLAETGRIDEARDAYRDALETRETLAASGDESAISELASLNTAIAEFHEARPDGRAALRYREEAATLRRQLSLAAPDDMDRLQSLSFALNGLGRLQKSLGLAEDALASLSEDLDIAARLAETDRSDTGLQRDLYISHLDIGDLKSESGDATGASKDYEQALAIMADLTKAEPDNAEFGWSFALVNMRLGDLYPNEEKYYADALAVLKRQDAAGVLREDRREWLAIAEEKLDYAIAN